MIYTAFCTTPYNIIFNSTSDVLQHIRAYFKTQRFLQDVKYFLQFILTSTEKCNIIFIQQWRWREYTCLRHFQLWWPFFIYVGWKGKARCIMYRVFSATQYVPQHTRYRIITCRSTPRKSNFTNRIFRCISCFVKIVKVAETPPRKYWQNRVGVI